MATLAEAQFSAWVLDQERQRLTDIDRARKYYEGDQDKPLKVLPGKADDNVLLNFVRPLIDKAADFMGTPDIECDSDTDKEWVDAWFKAARFKRRWRDVLLNGALAGHWYTRLVPGTEPSADGVTYPRLVVLDPETCRVLWDMEDAERVNEYRQQWHIVNPDGKPAVRRIRTYRNGEDGDAWYIEDAIGIDETFEPFALLAAVRWQIIGNVRWPYPWSPVLDCQNLPGICEYYGLPDVTDDMLELQDAINLSMTNISRILRFHAHPKTIATGVTTGRRAKSTKDDDAPGDIGGGPQTGPDQMWSFQDPAAKVYNLEMQSELTSSQEYYLALRSALFTAARTPDPRLVAELTGDVTNFRLQVMHGELLAKTDTKRMVYEEALTDLIDRAAEMMDVKLAEKRVVWPEAVPTGETELRQHAKTDIELQLASRRTWQERLGYDPDTEQAQIDKEQDAQMEREMQQQENVGSMMLNEFTGGRR